jgi:hypothetical protein
MTAVFCGVKSTDNSNGNYNCKDEYRDPFDCAVRKFANSFAQDDVCF